MAKLDGPLMSMGASGSIGGILTFGSNKGRNFVRQLVIPSNPRSAAQTGVRSMMKFVGQMWRNLTAPQQATWESRAAQTNISPFNAFSSKNMDNWSNDKAAQREDPAESATTTAFPTAITATAVERRINFAWTDSATGTPFGVIIYMSLTTGFTPGRDNSIAVVPMGTQIYTTVNLPPGTYFYRLTQFDIAGNIKTPASTQASVVVS